jgi:hypothetical protein
MGDNCKTNPVNFAEKRKQPPFIPPSSSPLCSLLLFAHIIEPNAASTETMVKEECWENGTETPEQASKLSQKSACTSQR